MWSGRTSSLQKTYDESYLKCSTAVYYESQGDEREAISCWRNALNQIQVGTGNKSQPPKSETERALVESLRELEVQCKERIDLLQALRISRQELSAQQFTHGSAAESDSPDDLPMCPDMSNRGWIGDGTIPAITYPELSSSPRPQRPSIASRRTSERAVVGSRNSLEHSDASSSARPPFLPSYSSPVPPKIAMKSPSPDRHTMRTTLRSGKSDRSNVRRRTPSKPNEGPGANKAATLAWTNLQSRTPAEKDPVAEHYQSPSSAPEGRSLQPPRLPRKQSQNSSSALPSHWDSHTRRLIQSAEQRKSPDIASPMHQEPSTRVSGDFISTRPSSLALGAASSALGALNIKDTSIPNSSTKRQVLSLRETRPARGSVGHNGSSSTPPDHAVKAENRAQNGYTSREETDNASNSHSSQRRNFASDDESTSSNEGGGVKASCSSKPKGKQKASPVTADPDTRSVESTENEEEAVAKSMWEKRKKKMLRNLPPGVDEEAAKSIFNEIVVQGDEVHWTDVAGLDIAKNALREAVVYPFLRPDLFMGLREPARGMLLFGPPGTGKTMLARAVATESKSTFFSISASSLTSKYLGESEKLVRALFALSKVMAPSIIFVDEIDSLLSQRSGSGEHEATRRLKTEFLIQWSDLQRAAAGRDSPGGAKDGGDPSRVLVLAATNLPWAIDEAARRRFVRRQYIPLPEPETRSTQLKTLLGQQKHSLTDANITELVNLTAGFSGSDITALAKDAAMGPLRSLGEAVLHMTMDQIRAIELEDFRASLRTIRPSVSQEGLKEYEDWARQFGERGG
ncbi:AAA-domain-containing protein [Xylariaceae sp. FL1019]|nr:AAA-domain-containing protein [Xylariaceae sp. FL1019]